MKLSILALSLAALLAAGSARAQEVPVRLTGALDTDAARRVREELDALGRSPEGPSVTSTARVVRVELAGVEGASLRAVVTDLENVPHAIEVARAQDDAVAVFALRVVEAVAQASRAHRTPTIAPETRVARWSVGVDAALTLAPGGVGAALHPRLRASYGDRASVHAIVGVPGVGGAIEGQGTSARLSVFEAGLGATAAVLRGDRARVELGLRASWMLLDGALSQGEGRAFDQTSTLAFFGLAAASGRIAGALGWRAELAWGATLSPLVVRIDDRLVAQWGRPLVVASAGVSLGL